MTKRGPAFQISPHSHVFLGPDHERAERRTWAVIILCTVMMIAEIDEKSLDETMDRLSAFINLPEDENDPENPGI